VSALPRRAWRAVERFADGPRAGPALVGAALLVYGLVSYALPLAAGRDLARYLLVYAQLFDADVVYPHAVLTRTPVAPLVAGGLLDLGPLAAEVGAAILYAVSVLAWCSVARRFGAAAAVATAAALLLYPGYVLLFHELASDAVFAAAFAVFAVACTRALEGPSAGRVAVLGASVALLVLVRPVAQVLLLLVLVPLLAARTWPGRIRATTAFVLAAGVPLLGWTLHNGVRLDDYTVARGGGASIPLFRAFVADRIVEPENGPASRELARAVARDLLPNEPYRSYGIDLDRFFSSGSSRMHDDLVVLADRTWDWDDDYRHLARVGREAVRAHPGTYLRGVARDTYRLLLWPLYPPGDTTEAAPVVAGVPIALGEPIAGGLPPPTEGQPIPSARTAPYLSTPDGRIREVWTSATEHHIVFSDPADTARAGALDRRVDELLGRLPDRDPRPGLVRWLDSASRWYPRPVLWLVIGLVAVAWRRPRRASVPLVLAGAAALVLVSTALAVYAVAEYSVPVVPAFVLLATVGVLGRYRPLGGAPEAPQRV
jgi:dolichyl-phosphate-mannose-protein mannosyltransferase